MDIRSERINKAIEDSGYSYTELAKLTGVSKSSLQRYATGQTKKIPIDCVEKIASITGVDTRYLMGWDEEPSAAPNSPQAQELTLLDNKKIRMIPVYNSVSAGFGAYADECRVGFMPIYVEHDYDAENMLAINVKGDSMYPKIEDGDTIVVRKQNDFENGDIVVVLIDKNEGLVKKIFAEKDKVTLVSINPEYKDRVFEGAEIERLDVVGVVKKLVKDI